jgi:hypothetical protein
MISSILRRTLAGTAATGVAVSLAVVGVGTPAASAAGQCNSGYPSSVSTSTSLTLAKTVGAYGETNRASVRVSSGAGTPTGRVTVTVGGASYSMALSGGRASHSLPRTLAAQRTHAVTARYTASSCYKGSSATKYYTVKRTSVAVRGVSARNIRKGGRPYVTGRVTTASGVTVGGQVTVRLYHAGHRRKTTTVSLRNGHFSAAFGKAYLRGTWTARATALSTSNHGSATGSDSFRVK